MQGKKFQFIPEKGGSWAFGLENAIFSNKLLFFFARQLRMTILDCCISLKGIKEILVVLGVVDMRHLLLIRQLVSYD